MTLLLRILRFSHKCNGVVCYDLGCWLSCSWAFKGMCPLHVHVFHVLGKLRIYLSSLQDVESLAWILVWKNPPLLILCWRLQYSTLSTADMFLLCRDKCGPHSWYSYLLHREIVMFCSAPCIAHVTSSTAIKFSYKSHHWP